MASNIHTIWFTDVEDKEKFKEALIHDTLVLGQLLKIVEQRLKTLNERELSESQFEKPNWAHAQAFLIGQKTELDYIRKLLKGVLG